MASSAKPAARSSAVMRLVEEDDMETPKCSVHRVVVLGPATAVVVRALWEVGLRPVRAQVGGTVWAMPGTMEWR